MNQDNINNFISLDTTLLCHSGAVFSSFTLYFDYMLSHGGSITFEKTKNGNVPDVSSDDTNIESGSGRHEVPINFRNLKDTVSFSVSVKWYDGTKDVKKIFTVQINKCNVHRKQNVLYKTNKRYDECKLTKRIALEKERSTLSTESTPTPTDTMFVYNPVETPSPTPINIDFSSSTLNTFGDWFNFDEVVAQIPYDVGDNSSIPIIFRNASFDFSNFPSLNLINHEEDRIDLLFYITRGDYLNAEPWNLYHDVDIDSAKAYGVWHENFDFLRGYEEFSLKPKEYVFENHVNPLGGLGRAVGKYKLGEAFEPTIPSTSVCMSGFLGYVNWEEWKQSGQTIMLHAYLVNNFDQFYWPIGDGADVMAHYKIPLSYYYLSGHTPTPYVEKTPTPETTPTPIPTPTPYPTPTGEIGFVAGETPTPTQTMVGIDNLNFDDNLKLLLEVEEIEDGPLNANTIYYSSDLNQKYTTDINCGDILTGQTTFDKNNLIHVRLLITDGIKVETWTETIGESQPGVNAKVSVSAPWNKIYITRNDSCEVNSVDIDLSYAVLHDIQIKSTENNQLYYPHQTLKLNLWKLDMENNKKDKIGEVKFDSVNSDVDGWWSPSDVSWDRQSVMPTPTPSQTEAESFQPTEPTPTPINTGDLLSWFSFDSADINVNNDDFHRITLKNVNVDNSNKPNSLSRELDYTLVVWSVVKRSFNHDLREAYMCDHSEECGGIDAPDAYGYNDTLKTILNKKEDALSSGYISASDYLNPSFDGNVGDLGFTSITKQSFMNFEDWRDGEELDLIVVFLTGYNGYDDVSVLAQDRIPLTLISTYETPTPAEFIESDPTPTPTPFTVHDLSSWMATESLQLNVLDNEIKDLTLNNVVIDNLAIPSFLGRPGGYEIISFVVVKRNYQESYADAYEGSSEMIYGSSANLNTSDKLLETFEDYYSLDAGSQGIFKIDNFAQNYGIVKGNYEESFMDWKQSDDVDLIVLFGVFDFTTGETLFNIEERFELTLNQTFSPTPTPADFAPEDETPTPVQSASLQNWISYESATINIVNGDFGGIVINNIGVNKQNVPDILSKEGDYDLVVYTLVKRSFDHNLREAYMCDHSEECGGVDSPDPFGYSNYLRDIVDGYEDELSAKLLSIDDYTKSLNGYEGDMGFSEITKQSFMEFGDWMNGEELDLVVLFLTGTGDDRVDVLVEDRIQLTKVDTIATPSPANFVDTVATPTPTPHQDHDLTSWFKYEDAQLTIVDGVIQDLVISDVSIVDDQKPKFLSKSRDIEIISWALTKKEFDGDVIETYESSSEYVYGNATEISYGDDTSLVSFKDYDSLYGILGDFKLSGFGSSYDIVMANFDDSFESWYGGDELNLAIAFGYYDLDNAENIVLVQEKISVSVNSISTATPTPGDFAANETTPTPLVVKSLQNWVMYDSATINIENDEFKNIILSKILVDPTNVPDSLNRLGEYNVVAWTLVKRSFDHELHEAYICDHSEDCGGIDSPDPFGFSTKLFKFRFDIKDYLSPAFESISDYKSQRFALNVGDMGFDEITTQSFMSFKDWRNDEELDLVLTIITGSNDESYPSVLLTDRIQLTTVNSYVTPSPVDFQAEEPTPTPTPLQDHDFKTWFNFESATLNLFDSEMVDLRLTDVNVVESKIPKFLKTSREIEIISFAIVKKAYEGSHVDVYENSSSMVYATSYTLRKELDDDQSLNSFSDYSNLKNGFNGEFVLDDFEVNFGIVSANFSNSFSEWRGDDEVILWVMFGYHDLASGQIIPQLEDKFAMQLNTETTEELFGDITPTPDMSTPTPTPFSTQDVLSWISFDSANINLVNDEFGSLVLSDVSVNHANKPNEISRTQDYNVVVWSIVKRSFNHDLREAYMCDHSEECGGIDAPDAFG